MDDNLITIDDKKVFANNIDRLVWNQISMNEVDGKIFKSTQHGLGADFLKMFEFTMKNYSEIKTDKKILLNNVMYETSKRRYCFDYSNMVPQLKLE